MKSLPRPLWIDRSTANWSRLFQAWSARASQFYFAESGARSLAFVRIVFFSFVAWKAFHSNLASVANTPAVLWEPVTAFAWLAEPIFSSEFLLAVQLAFSAVCACCALGLGFRLFSVIAIPLSLIHYGLPNCYGKLSHNSHLAVLAIAIFAVSQAAAVWSLDAWFERRRGIPRPQVSGEFTWPLRTLQTLFVVIMCAAGISKLRTSGLEWALSDNLLNTMLRRHYHNDANPGSSLSLTLVHYPWLCQLLAVGSLFIELTAPVALFSRWYRWFVIPSLLGMQLGIYLTMGIYFHFHILLYIVWVDWNMIFAWIQARIPVGHTERTECPTNSLALRSHCEPSSRRTAA